MVGHAQAQAWDAEVVFLEGLLCRPLGGAAWPLGQRQRQAGWHAGHSGATQAGAATRREAAGGVPGHHGVMYTHQTRVATLAKDQRCPICAYTVVKPVTLGLSGLATC